MKFTNNNNNNNNNNKNKNNNGIYSNSAVSVSQNL